MDRAPPRCHGTAASSRRHLSSLGESVTITNLTNVITASQCASDDGVDFQLRGSRRRELKRIFATLVAQHNWPANALSCWFPYWLPELSNFLLLSFLLLTFYINQELPFF